MYVVTVWCHMDGRCSIKQAGVRNQAAIDVLRLMTMTDGESYAILIAGEKRCYGCVGFTENPFLALTDEAVVQLSDLMVQCTHSFVNTLKSYRRVISPNDLLVYKNSKSQMTSKSCNNYCLRSIIDDDNLLSEVVDECDENVRGNDQHQ